MDAGGCQPGSEGKDIGLMSNSVPSGSERASRTQPDPKPPRNATAAVVGAGDYIGSAIAKRFAAEGYTVVAGRRNGDKLAPLVAEIEAAGGRCVAQPLDARQEAEVAAFMTQADAVAPLEVCVFNVGGNVAFPLMETTERVFRKVWEMACYAGFLTGREAARAMLPHGARLDLLHRRHGEPARRQRLCRVRRRQGRAARHGAGDGARARAAEHPRGPSRHRRRRRHCLGA